MLRAKPFRHFIAGLSLMGLSIAAQATATLRVIDSFETPRIPAVVCSNATAVSTTSFATQGTSSLAVSFAAGSWAEAKFSLPTPQDWSTGGGMAADIKNIGTSSATIWFMLDDDGVGGTGHGYANPIVIPAGDTTTVIMQFGAAPSGAAYGLKAVPPLAPGGHTIVIWSPINYKHIVEYRLFTLSTTSVQHICLDNVRLMSPYSASAFTSLVDRYGQSAQSTSADKVTSDADFGGRLAAEQSWLASHPAPTGRDTYGGTLSSPTFAGTGYFRTTQYNGKWWFVTPSGHRFFSTGLSGVNPTLPTNVGNRQAMFQWLPEASDPLSAQYGAQNGVATYDFYRANLTRKFGANAASAWTSETASRLQSWGFNSLGWADMSYYGALHMPYTVWASTSGSENTISTGSDMWARMPDPYDPRFRTSFADQLSSVGKAQIADPYCLGYYVDNELSWSNGQANGRYSLAWGVLAQDAASSPAKAAFIAILQKKYGAIGALNAAWATAFASWSAASASAWTVPAAPTAAVTSDLSLLSLSFARQYFATVRSVLKAFDPNHLYLGCRFSRQTPEALQAASENCDVVSMNLYMQDLWSQASAFAALNKPVIISEFQFGAMDSQLFGASMVEAFDQNARGVSYTAYVTSALSLPSVIGCQWFQYLDDPVAGRPFDGENWNIGFVDVTDTPYSPLVEAARATNLAMYATRGS